MRGLLAGRDGEPLTLGNEFAEVRISKVRTRNGVRLLIEAPKSGQWVTLDPLELEALTWQSASTFSAMVGRPFVPLFSEEDER
nr:dihydrodiol dehydrogenase [Nocardia australiensis]